MSDRWTEYGWASEALDFLNNRTEPEWFEFPAQPTYTYVICQQSALSEPHLFWSNDNGWVDLYAADHFTIDDVHTYGNTPVVDGFWLDFSRAEELIRE